MDVMESQWYLRVTLLGAPSEGNSALLECRMRAGARSPASLPHDQDDSQCSVIIPRNHMVEEALTAAAERQDFAPFDTLVALLAHPFDDHPDHPRHALPPRAEERVLATFCGT